MHRVRNSEKRSSLASPPQKPLLLYVEDDDDNWEVAEIRLSSSYELLRARDGREACALLRAHAADIELVLMDIELRGSDLTGIELTRLFRGEPLPEDTIPPYARDLRPFSKPIVFVTAHGAKHTRVKLMLSGAEQVIVKPIDFGALQAAIAALTSSGSR